MSDAYNTFNQHPWHGVGQGAVDAALRYIVLSDTLIDAYHTKVHPWSLCNPTLTLMIVKSLKAFINDVAMLVGGDAPSFNQLIQRAQTQLQWWMQLIRASGGELNSQKCYCMTYTWAPNEAGILRQSAPVAVTISPCSQNPQQTIPVLKPNKGT